MSKKVLITGSSRGIGLAVAKNLSSAGYEVILHARSKSDALLAASKELNAQYICADVSDFAACKEAFSPLEDDLYGIVLNAGITSDAVFAALSEDDWQSVVQTNLGSFYAVLNPLIMGLIRRRCGRIVVMSSASGVMGNRGQCNYAASKAGLIGAAKSLALELASRNITVNVVAPGLIDTDMSEDLIARDQIIAAIPARRSGSAEEVAALVGFLLSEQAGYITKQVIGINGGLC